MVSSHAYRIYTMKRRFSQYIAMRDDGPTLMLGLSGESVTIKAYYVCLHRQMWNL